MEADDEKKTKELKKLAEGAKQLVILVPGALSGGKTSGVGVLDRQTRESTNTLRLHHASDVGPRH